jgi:membrane protein
VARQVLGLVAAGLVDLVLFTASFRVLTAAEVTTRQVLPGALLASGCWLGLQAIGGVFVTQVLAGSSETYGGFAAVIGLLTSLLIAAEVFLIAAELNVVCSRRLWPRSLTGDLLEADKRALRAVAYASRLDPRQNIAVRFEHRDGPPSGPNAREEQAGDESRDRHRLASGHPLHVVCRA